MWEGIATGSSKNFKIIESLLEENICASIEKKISGQANINGVQIMKPGYFWFEKMYKVKWRIWSF